MKRIIQLSIIFSLIGLNLSKAQILSETRISAAENGFIGAELGPIVEGALFGSSVVSLGDLDNDGIGDVAVGAPEAGDGQVWILFLNEDGSIKKHHGINDGVTELTNPIDRNDRFGSSLTTLGKINNDGTLGLAVGVPGYKEDLGALWILFLNSNGTVNSDHIITSNESGFSGKLDSGDLFGISVANLGDIDGDGIEDLSVGASGDSLFIEGEQDQFEQSGKGYGSVWTLLMNADGTVKSSQNINGGKGGLVGNNIEVLDSNDQFGSDVTIIGDLNGDNIPDLAVGAPFDTPEEKPFDNTGVVWILFMNENGTVLSSQRITQGEGNFQGTLLNGDQFGSAVAGIGDLDGDGILDLAVGAIGDRDGTNSSERGALWILFMKADGTVKEHSKISTTVGGLQGRHIDVVEGNAYWGSSIVDIGDLDGDGINEFAVGAPGWKEDYGYSDSFGKILIIFPNVDGSVRKYTEIGQLLGAFRGELNSGDGFGFAIANVGDLDGDGRAELAVGAPGDDDGNDFEENRGAVWILFLDENGEIIKEQKISSLQGQFQGELKSWDFFGSALAGLGDLDDDGIPDLAVTATGDDDEADEFDSRNSRLGAMWILFLNDDGTVKTYNKISASGSVLLGVKVNPIKEYDLFGSAITQVGDLDGDSVSDIVVGLPGYDADVSLDLLDTGALMVLLMNADGSVKSHHRIGANQGGFTGELEFQDFFGSSVAVIGDLDGNGIADLAVGAPGDDGEEINGTRNNYGAVWILFMDEEANVIRYQKISKSEGEFEGTLERFEGFGTSVSSLGDLNRDGIEDLAVGAPGNNSGTVWVLFLNEDGTVRTDQRIDSKEGNLLGGVPDVLRGNEEFGSSISTIGDLDGNGAIDLLAGSPGYFDNEKGFSTGGIRILYLESDGTIASHAVLDDITGINGEVVERNSRFGASIEVIGDLNGDGSIEIAVGAPLTNASDLLWESGAVWFISLDSQGKVISAREISGADDGLAGLITRYDRFGESIASVGDIDGDGIEDLIVGAPGDDGESVNDDYLNYGALWVFFLNADGSIKSYQKIGQDNGGFEALLNEGDFFGSSITSLGDLNRDGIPDIAVGSPLDDDDGLSGDSYIDKGAIWILFLNADGGVDSYQKISESQGGFNGNIDPRDQFGSSLETMGDLDGDGVIELIVGAIGDEPADGSNGSNGSNFDDIGGPWILFLNTDGTVKNNKKLILDDGRVKLNRGDLFGSAIQFLGDIDEDGAPTLAIGAPFGDDARNNVKENSGSIWFLEIEQDIISGDVQKISNLKGGLVSPYDEELVTLDMYDQFGSSLALIPDLDGDGLDELLVGATGDDDYYEESGAVYMLYLNADGTVKRYQKISNSTVNFEGILNLGESFGKAITMVENAISEETVKLAIGSVGYYYGIPGSVWMVTMDFDGAIQNYSKINMNTEGLGGGLDTGDDFGFAMSFWDDLDGDGIPELLVGAPGDDDTLIDPIQNPGSVWIVYLDENSSVKNHSKISNSEGGLPLEVDPNAQAIEDGDRFGTSITVLGDWNGDSVVDLAVGADGDDNGGEDRGALWLLYLNRDGSINNFSKISATEGSFEGDLNDDDRFGASIVLLPDLDNDGTDEILVGAPGTDNRENDILKVNSGAVWLLYMAADGTVKSHHKIDENVAGVPGVLDQTDQWGSALSITGDLDGNGVNEVIIGSPGDDDANSDGNLDAGALWVLFMNRDGTVSSSQKISNLEGNLANFDPSAPLIDNGDFFGQSIISLGDIEGDGIMEFAVGSPGDNDGGYEQGAVWILSIDQTGTITSYQKISATQGGFLGELDISDWFGHSLSSAGDIDGNGIPDLIVGAPNTSDRNSATNTGGYRSGAAWVLFLDENRTVIADQKISATNGNFGGHINSYSKFGHSMINLGDIDGNGIEDLIVGSPGLNDLGGAWILFMEPDGTIKSHQLVDFDNEILSDSLRINDRFGSGIGSLGDLNNDGIIEVAMGAPGDDDSNLDQQNRDSGAVWHLSIDKEARVQSYQKISNMEGLLAPFDSTATLLDINDRFGESVAAIGDLNNDGTVDLAVGAPYDDTNDSDQGAVWIIFLYPDGALHSFQKVSPMESGFNGYGNLRLFGSSITSLAVTEEGKKEIIVGEKMQDFYYSQREPALWKLSLDSEGRVTNESKLPISESSLKGLIDNNDDFGYALTSMGDINQDGFLDLAVGAPRDNDSDDDWKDDTGSLWFLSLKEDGTIKSHKKISNLSSNFKRYFPDNRLLDSGDFFARSVAVIGDVDQDGINDLAVGAPGDDNGTIQSSGSQKGAVWILFMTEDNKVKAHQKISATKGNFEGSISERSEFGFSVSELGDLDGNNAPDIVVGSPGDNKAWVLFLNSDGTVSKTQELEVNGALSETEFGTSITILGDLDGDNIPEIAVGAPGVNSIWILFLTQEAKIKKFQRIDSRQGNFTGGINAGDDFGYSLSTLPDIDNDEIKELVVGTPGDDDGSIEGNQGAIWILFLNSDGTVKESQKISKTSGGFGGDLAVDDRFGSSIVDIGDYNGDGIADLAVGASGDDDEARDLGAVWLLFLTAEGKVSGYEKISAAQGEFGETMQAGDFFGSTLASVNPLEESREILLAIGAPGSSQLVSGDSLLNSGALWLLTVQKNRGPYILSPIPDTTLNVISGSEIIRIPLDSVFADPDGESLTFLHQSSNTDVAVTSLEFDTLAISVIGTGTAIIEIKAIDRRDIEASTSFTIEALSQEAPIFTGLGSTNDNVGVGESFSIFADVESDNLERVVLNFKAGGDNLFLTTELESTSDGRFEFSVPQSIVTERGIIYNIEAIDIAGSRTISPTRSIQVNVSDGISKGLDSTRVGQYRMVSAPLNLKDSTASGLFSNSLGQYNDTRWRLFELNSDQSYEEYNSEMTQTPGKGFMLIVNNPGLFLTTGSGTSIALDTLFSMPLHQGWNMAGSPFAFPIAWEQVYRLNDGILAREELLTYNGNAFIPVDQNTTSLEPFSGYLIYSTQNDTLIINPDPSNPSLQLIETDSTEILGGSSAWSLNISATAGSVSDTNNRIIASKGSAISWDKMDKPEPPAFGEYVSLSFPHPEWETVLKHFSVDARPEPETCDIWDVEVRSNLKQEINLTFVGIDNVPENLDLWLVDEVLLVSQDLRISAAYSFAGAGERFPKQLKLVIGEQVFCNETLKKMAVLPDQTSLSQNFPNPFKRNHNDSIFLA